MSSRFSRGYAAIGLVNPKCEHNIGGVLRASGCYGAAFVALSGKRFKKSGTDTQKTWRHRPLLQVDDLKLVIPYGCIPVAVDLVEGASPLHEYIHPERAFYVFGPEDGTIGSDVLSWCRDRIMVPTFYCMNLAATVNVVLYDRQSKS